MSRATHARLYTQHLRHNIERIRTLAPRSEIMAMVKANAYGHGLRSISRRLAPIVDRLGVASIDEALALRAVGITLPITLMEGVFEPSEWAIAAQHDFHVVLHHQVQVAWLDSQPLDRPVTVWLKIDTGMGRLGFSMDDAARVYDTLSARTDIVQPIGCMSHFACADEPEHVLHQTQSSRFADFVRTRPGPRSLCNSAGIWGDPVYHYDVVRPGIAVYGVSPFVGVTSAQLDLKPVMSLHTQLIATRWMRKGDTIGYGARYACPEHMPVGVVAFGYGDGLLRSAQDGMPVLVNDRRCALAGRVSMDMMTIDLRGCPDAQVGDPVTLWGPGLEVTELVPYTSHAAYDILTGVQPRVRFQWVDE